jgi:hypothetical protein
MTENKSGRCEYAGSKLGLYVYGGAEQVWVRKAGQIKKQEKGK